MDKLIELNRHFRMQRPLNPDSNYIDYYFSGTFLEIAFPVPCCNYDKKGFCTMCNYGTGNPITDRNKIKKQLLPILQEYEYRTNSLMIGTNGSIFDSHAFPLDFLCEVLKVVKAFSYKTIIFETHFSTVTLSLLQLIKELLPDKQIFIESGLESSNCIIQKYCYAKVLSLDFVLNKIDLIHTAGIHTYINVILGAPFLNIFDQKQDCLDTTRWILKHNCAAVIFPLNIKPFTTIEYMYQNQLYTPISLWMLFDVLQNFSARELEYIDIAWYGNRIDEYVEADCNTIFPNSCTICSENLQTLFDQYNQLKNGKKRYEIIKRFEKHQEQCSCLNKYLTTLLSAEKSNNITNTIYHNRTLLFNQAVLDRLLSEV